jgi:hypothetical protein
MDWEIEQKGEHIDWLAVHGRRDDVEAAFGAMKATAERSADRDMWEEILGELAEE